MKNAFYKCCETITGDVTLRCVTRIAAALHLAVLIMLVRVVLFVAEAAHENAAADITAYVLGMGR
tara:strand:+ start:1333 stop:1527 length:195 start_codon:yes stop_codon:yes gene_type:complete